MENSVNNRIRLVYKSLNITLKSFSEKANISEGSLKNMFSRGTKPSFDILEKIANAYSQISMDWLITGQGSMYNESTTHRGSSISITGDNNVSQSLSGNGKIGSLNIETKNTSVLEERVAQLEKQIEQLEQDKAFLQDLVSMQKEKIDMLTKNR